MKIYILLFKYQKLLFKILHQKYLVRKDVREKHDTVGKDVKDSFILLKDLGLFFFPLSIIGKHILHNVLSSTYVKSNVFIRHSQTSQSAARQTFRLQDWVQIYRQ